jgi:uroporphyrin-III C-methyltransferase/precorrin-2 dehydrogenase/sirohydrochlorin ferrochelatase/uroporphyrin-III C-methyltransferase
MTQVFLVGAGPGDPELLTRKAYRLLQAADVVLHDSLVDRRIIDQVRRDALCIDVGKRCAGRATPQREIGEVMCKHALGGRLVVRLKGGDPMVFGRASEEMAALAEHGIAYEIVPGVTAATAAAAALQCSLTQRKVARSLHFLTGHGAEGGLPAHDWVALTQAGGTLVIYMGGATVAGIASHFIEAGMAPAMPAIAIENISLPDERIFRSCIAALPGLLGAAKPAGPVLLMIGDALKEARGVAEIAADCRATARPAAVA